MILTYQAVAGSLQQATANHFSLGIYNTQRVNNVPPFLPSRRYVGLTDEWALSICLLHAKLGGRCLRAEFDNSRPTTSRLTRLPWIRNTSLRDYTAWAAEEVARVGDPFDEALYEAVEARFRAEVAQHRLSRERCEALCPDAPAAAFASARFEHGGES